MPGSPEISRDSAVLIKEKEKVLTAILRIEQSKLFLCGFIKRKGGGSPGSIDFTQFVERSSLFLRNAKIITERNLIVNSFDVITWRYSVTFFVTKTSKKVMKMP